MSKYKMISPKVPNVPWQERPAELNGAPVWRYKENPIIGRNPVKGVARIFMIERLEELVGGKLGICKGCFTGKYPMEPPAEDIRGDFDK